MFHRAKLAELDRDDAIQETAEEAADAVRAGGTTRAAFLTRGGLLVGAGLGLGSLPIALAGAQGGLSDGDVRILNYALTLEYLEAAFYADALRRAGLRGNALAFARTAHTDEQAHVDALKRTLGGKAVKQPRFDFMDATGSQDAFLQNGADVGGHRRLRLPGPGAADRLQRRARGGRRDPRRRGAARGLGRGPDRERQQPVAGARRLQPRARHGRRARGRQKNRLHPMRRTRPMADIHPTLDELDRDGALREAGARVDPLTRGSFLRRALAIAGGAAAAGVALPALATPAAFAQSGGSDVDILNYALTLEYLEAAFYAEAVARGALSGELATFARTVAAHEQAHVDALKRALGGKAVKRPSFDFKGTTGSQDAFWRTALTLEDTGVEAYQGAAVNIQSRDPHRRDLDPPGRGAPRRLDRLDRLQRRHLAELAGAAAVQPGENDGRGAGDRQIDRLHLDDGRRGPVAGDDEPAGDDGLSARCGVASQRSPWCSSPRSPGSA